MTTDEIPSRPAPQLGDKFLKLLGVLDRLRAADGCPWDREQTPRSLIPYLLEETYEVIESIEAEDSPALKEELGDLLLHVLFQGAMAEEAGTFTLEESIVAITQKLVDRHPHVFGAARADGPWHAKQNWEAAKQRQKGRASRLDGVPATLPALTRAKRLQEKAAYVGFDWQTVEPVWAKVREELGELEDARKSADPRAQEEELGDLLFSLVNLGRFLKIDAEGALRGASAKFEYRFRRIERELLAQGKKPEDASLDEMNAIWDRYRGEAAPR